MSRANPRSASVVIAFALLCGPITVAAQPSRPAPTRPAPRRTPRAAPPAPPAPPVPVAPPAPPPAEPTAAPQVEPEAPPVVVAPPEAPAPSPLPSVSPALRPPWIDAEVGPRLFGRSMFFTDDVFQQLRPYDLALAPAVSGALEFYPGALFSSGVASWFGLVARGQTALGVASVDAQGRSYTTTAYGFSVGARMRLRFWRIEAGLTVAYDAQHFSINRADAGRAPPEGIPSVGYESLRVGLSARVQIVPRLAVRAAGYWLAVLGGGEVTSEAFFPRATVHGVEASLGVAFALLRHLELRLDGDWRRYVFSMNPVVGDRLVAGGAADDYYGATFSVAFRR